MTVRRTFIVLVAILLAIPLIGVTLKANQSVNQQTQQQQQPAATETAGNGFRQSQAEATATPVPGISALGSVAAESVLALSFQGSGTINGVYVNPGDYVKTGDVLADLDLTDATNTYTQAQLNLQKAQLALDALNAPPSADDLKVAQANVASAQAAYGNTANAVSSSTLQSAQGKYQQAEDSLAALQQERSNMNGDPNQIAMKEAQIGAASFNAEIARLQLVADQTPNSASLWAASIRIAQAQLNLQKLQVGPTQAQLDSAQIALERAQSQLKDAELTLEHTQLVSPSNGYVTTVNIKKGDSSNGFSTASTSSTVSGAIVLSDLDHLQITVPVNELDLNKIKIGSTATIALDSLPDLSIPGAVETLGWLSKTSSDGIVTYNVQIGLNTNDPRVRIGMTGEVVIDTGSQTS